MAAMSERALRKAMRERAFERVYYFVGDDDFLKESTAKELIAAVVDPGTRDFNYDLVRGTDATAERLDTALDTPPLFADRRAVTVRDVQALRKEARLRLLAYLAQPADNTVLVLVAPAGEKSDRTIADRSTVVEFAPLTGDRVPRWIIHHAETELRTRISPEAATLLLECVGPDLGNLAAELDKLASFTAGASIGEEAVRAVVGARQGESLGDLLDAVLVRDGARAAGLVTPVLSAARTSAVAVIMALSTQLLAVSWGRTMRDRGMSPRMLEREYFTLLRESRVYPGRPWGEAVAGWMRALPHWTAPQLDQAIRLLLAADAAAKEARVSSEEQLVGSLVLSLCASDTRRTA
jgi:DNA polymerase-3 subunit delta